MQFPFSSAALSILYQRYIGELLREVTDLASVASYRVNFAMSTTGIRLEFSGYSDPEVVTRFITDVLNGKRWRGASRCMSVSAVVYPSGSHMLV